MKENFTQGEVNKIFCHLPSRTTRSWMESGLVEWSGEREDRRGILREYEIRNLWQLALVEKLMSLTTSVKQVKKWMNYVNAKMLKKMPDLWSDSILVVKKEEPYIDEKFEASDAENTLHAQLIKTADADSTSIKDLQKVFGVNSSIIVVDLSTIVKKVEFLIKKANL